MEMKYRKANINDANKLDELLSKLITDEKEKYDNTIEQTEVTDFYKSYIDKEGHQIFICECDSVITGYVYVIAEGEIKAQIKALYVEEECRKQGIGLKLIGLAKDWLKEKNIKSVEINVMSENIAAKKIYAKAGFNTFKETMKLEIEE